MLLNSKKVKSLCTFGLTLALMCSNIPAVSAKDFQDGETNEYIGGLKGPSVEEENWIKENMIETKSVLPNKSAIERINKSRESKGLNPKTNLKTANFGQEVSPADSSDKTTLSESNLSIAAYTDGNSLSTDTLTSSDFPVSVDNSTSKYYPGEETQGSIGSCSAMSSTYYQASYMTALARNWDLKSDKNYSKKLSPKWTYNFINSGMDEGSNTSEAYTLLKEQGAATWNDFPYDGHGSVSKNYLEWAGNPKVWENAANNRIDKTGVVRIWDETNTPVKSETDSNLDNIKKLLLNGYILVINYSSASTKMTKISNNTDSTADDAYVGETISYMVNGSKGGHGQAIVGYNDAIWTDIDGDGSVDPGEKGAFKLQGGTWISYDALNTVSAVPGLPADKNRTNCFWYNNSAFWLTARTSYTPKLLGEVTINHAKRDQLQYQIGYSETTSSDPTITWTPNILNKENGAVSFNGTDGAAYGTVVIDYTNLMELNSNINFSDKTKRWYMRITDKTADDNAAVIKDFRLVDPATGYITYYNGPSSTIDNSTVTLSIDYALGTPKPSVAPPTFSINPGTYKYAKNLTITTETPNATIRYTTNGETPTTSSAAYEGPISVYGNMYFRAALEVDGKIVENTMTNAYYNAGHKIGDVNGDGELNVLDAMYINKYIAKTITNFPVSDGISIADVNADGVIDSTDSNLAGSDNTDSLKKYINTHLVGDVNDDERIDNTDVLLINKYLTKGTALPVDNALWAADVNGDNAITSADADLITQFSEGTISIFPKAHHIYKLGDVNGDGKINVLDIAHMQKYITGAIPTLNVPDDLWTGDLNGDCVIDSSDLAILKKFVLSYDGSHYIQKERIVHNIGDAYGENEISLSTYALIQRIARGTDSEYPCTDILWTCDVNGDGIIDASDASLVREYLFAQRTTFPKSSMTPITVS
ncbi:dockerin type I domain-containing protein [Clostridium cibarium]|uniref:Chitobiase/beta-hexosaminidase C-terminal domain-containing protein n=1 Tax=Clostridium cibarium TaxID=2762247 RepID=A0ABR8PW88_9CLOT|nr:dockerin type I domain-containing protein [Clostridium cibarium]MBD7912423.1 chitobiase/beta-hexosaminidase C-terminal domain-containing protein [Clostridium cibarium]